MTKCATLYLQTIRNQRESDSNVSNISEKSMLPQVVSNSSGSKAADLTVALQADVSLDIRW